MGIRGRYLQTGNVRFSISKNELNRQIASYGIPQESISFSYRKGDLARMQALRKRAFAKRGIINHQNQLSPDYRWIIRQSRKSTAPIATALKQSFHKKLGKSGKDMIAYVTGFVQNLQYRIPDSPRGWPWNPELKINTIGVNMPLETLYNGWGDCDTKSVLLATLLGNFAKINTVFVQGNQHVFVGIAGMPRRNEHFITYKNIKYILIETTRPWPIGRIPQKNWLGIHKNQFRVFQVQ